jgi:hypothetical protein
MGQLWVLLLTRLQLAQDSIPKEALFGPINTRRLLQLYKNLVQKLMVVSEIKSLHLILIIKCNRSRLVLQVELPFVLSVELGGGPGTG